MPTHARVSPILPEYLVEVAFDSDPGDESPTYTDVTQYVRSAEITRGRQHELDRFEAGTARVVFRNEDRRFDPTFAGVTNLITNPSVETNTTGYAAINSSMGRNNSGPESVGTFGLDVTTTNVLDSGVNYGGVGVLPASPGVAYTFSLDARLRDPGSKSMEVLIVFLNSGGTLIDFKELLVTLNSTSFQRYALSGNAPAGTAAARVAIQTKVAGGVFHFYTDGWLFQVAAGPIVNLIDNPTFEVDTSGYSGTNGSIARSNAAGVPFSGSWGLVATTTNVQYSGIKYDPSAVITPGLPYTFSAYARLASAGSKAMGIWISWFDDSSNSISDDYQPFTLNSTTFARFSVTATAPPLASYVELYIITDAAVGIFGFHVDALQFEQAAAPTTYVDGSLPTGFWDGTAHASPSHLATPTAYFDGSLPGARWSGTAHASTSIFGGLYFGKLLPNKKLRITEAWDSVEYIRFVGYIDGWAQRFPNSVEALVEVNATDGFKILNRTKLNVSFVEEDTNDRVANVLDEIGWPDADRDIVGGISTIQAVDLAGETALAHLQAVELAESGRLFMRAGGRLRFEDRHTPYQSSSTFTFTEAHFGLGIQVNLDDSQVYNEIRVTNEVGTTQVQSDAASIAQTLAPLTMELSGMQLIDDNEANSLAQFRLTNYKDPHTRIPEMPIRGAKMPAVLWPVLLALELGDRVTLSFTPPAGGPPILQESFVEGIQETLLVADEPMVIRLSAVGIAYNLGTPFVIGTDALTTGPGVLVY